MVITGALIYTCFILVYYGLSYNADELVGSFYLNSALFGFRNALKFESYTNINEKWIFEFIVLKIPLFNRTHATKERSFDSHFEKAFFFVKLIF